MCSEPRALESSLSFTYHHHTRVEDVVALVCGEVADDGVAVGWQRQIVLSEVAADLRVRVEPEDVSVLGELEDDQLAEGVETRMRGVLAERVGLRVLPRRHLVLVCVHHPHPLRLHTPARIPCVCVCVVELW